MSAPKRSNFFGINPIASHNVASHIAHKISRNSTNAPAYPTIVAHVNSDNYLVYADECFITHILLPQMSLTFASREHVKYPIFMGRLVSSLSNHLLMQLIESLGSQAFTKELTVLPCQWYGKDIASLYSMNYDWTIKGNARDKYFTLTGKCVLAYLK